MATITVKELSEQLDTNPRMARKFLRAVTPVEDHPGKGGRWSLEKAQVRSLKKQFATYLEEHTRPEVPADAEDPAETE